MGVKVKKRKAGASVNDKQQLLHSGHLLRQPNEHHVSFLSE